MPLKIGNPPAGALQIVSNAINDMRAQQISPTESLKDLATAPQADTPLQVFTLGLDDVIEKDLTKAQPGGWRYTISSNEQPVAAAEVDSLGGEALQFSHLNEGPFVVETVNAMKQAESLDAVAETEYEARILKIPALYVMALWMHSEADDILIPMPPTNEGLIPKKPYSPEEFFAGLLPSAETRTNFDDSPQGQPSMS